MKDFIKIKIIYEDNHLLVVEKPRNMLTQGDRTGDKDLLSLLKQDIKIRYNKPGNVFLGLVHRLDRPVGGVMVFARTSKAASRLSDMIRRRAFEKVYLAVLEGIPDPLERQLRHNLAKDRKHNTVKVVAASSGKGKEAVLEYNVISSCGELSLVEVNLLTGRPHQIRVQFSHEGTPVYGDTKYGSGEKDSGIALWSYSLSFKHPTKGEAMNFKSQLPDERPWNFFDINTF